GRATGENRARQAAERAISSPMLESSMDGARGVLLSVSGPTTMSLREATEAARVVSDHADAEAEIIFGAIVDDNLGEEMKVTVIAAGFEGRRRPNRPVRTETGGYTGTTTERRGGGDFDDELEVPSFVQGWSLWTGSRSPPRPRVTFSATWTPGRG